MTILSSLAYVMLIQWSDINILSLMYSSSSSEYELSIRVNPLVKRMPDKLEAWLLAKRDPYILSIPFLPQEWQIRLPVSDVMQLLKEAAFEANLYFAAQRTVHCH